MKKQISIILALLLLLSFLTKQTTFAYTQENMGDLLQIDNRLLKIMASKFDDDLITIWLKLENVEEELIKKALMVEKGMDSDIYESSKRLYEEIVLVMIEEMGETPTLQLINKLMDELGEEYKSVKQEIMEREWFAIYDAFVFENINDSRKILYSDISSLTMLVELTKKEIESLFENEDIKEVSLSMNALVGDIDCDDEVTISDVTLIQKHLANLEVFTPVQMILADVLEYNVSISCVTSMQKFLANFETNDAVIGEYFNFDQMYIAFYSYLQEERTVVNSDLKHIGFRYYGTYSDCKVVFVGTNLFHSTIKRYISVAGYTFYFPNSMKLLVYQNSSLTAIEDAYDAGLISSEDIKRLWSSFPEFYLNA